MKATVKMLMPNMLQKWRHEEGAVAVELLLLLELLPSPCAAKCVFVWLFVRGLVGCICCTRMCVQDGLESTGLVPAVRLYCVGLPAACWVG